MKTQVDARGRACPEPVLMARKALEGHDEVVVLVDNPTSVENLRRLAVNGGCGFSVVEESGAFSVTLIRRGPEAPLPTPEAVAAAASCALGPGPKTGPVVVLLTDRCLGRGDDVLGDLLMKSFLHTLGQTAPLPARIICYNAAVKLAVQDSPVLEDLQEMAAQGVEILLCGTCVNYYGLEGKIGAGRFSNMAEILEALTGPVRLVRP
jgi:selenium metabolism protein YedF